MANQFSERDCLYYKLRAVFGNDRIVSNNDPQFVVHVYKLMARVEHCEQPLEPVHELAIIYLFKFCDAFFFSRSAALNLGPYFGISFLSRELPEDQPNLRAAEL